MVGPVGSHTPPTVQTEIISTQHSLIERAGLNQQPMSKRVVEFVGSSLADRDRIGRAAHPIAKECVKGAMLIVVSAMEKKTDRLISLVHKSEKSLDKTDFSEILVMGKKINIRVFAAALEPPVHNVVTKYGEAMAVQCDLAFMKINDIRLEEGPGISARICTLLRATGISLSSMLTFESSIIIFVSWNDKGEVLIIVKQAVKERL